MVSRRRRRICRATSRALLADSPPCGVPVGGPLVIGGRDAGVEGERAQHLGGEGAHLGRVLRVLERAENPVAVQFELVPVASVIEANANSSPAIAGFPARPPRLPT